MNNPLTTRAPHADTTIKARTSQDNLGYSHAKQHSQPTTPTRRASQDSAPDVGFDHRPYKIARDTWVIPQIGPAGPEEFFSINSAVIRGTEPVIVDTGTVANRERWLQGVFEVVDAADIRWIFLSHGDRDHTGNALELLDVCPNATVVTTFWGVRHLLADGPPPLTRLRWVNDGEPFSAGDRLLYAVRPPLWDATGTRGLFDPRTRVYWAADSFASLQSKPVTNADQLDHDYWRESFLYEHRSYAEWIPLLDNRSFAHHVRRSEQLRPSVIASAHGPVLSSPMIDEAYQMLYQLPDLGSVPEPGPTMLNQMIDAVAAIDAEPTAA
jgi:flavorubredoxin